MFCWDIPKNSGNSGQNTHKFAVIMGTNDGKFDFSHKAGSFIWWSVRISQLFLIFFPLSGALCLCFVCKNVYFHKLSHMKLKTGGIHLLKCMFSFSGTSRIICH